MNVNDRWRVYALRLIFLTILWALEGSIKWFFFIGSGKPIGHITSSLAESQSFHVSIGHIKLDIIPHLNELQS